MKFFGKTLGLLLASLTLASCGGGGGDGGTFTAPQNGTITLSADTTTLPLNTGSVLPFPASPFMATVSVTFRSANGTIMAPSGDATFTTSNANVVSISPPDDPSTTDVNEFQQRMVSFHQILNNGSGAVFVNAYNVAGTATLTVSAVDPQTNVTVSKTLSFTVSSGIGPQPASIQLSANPSSVYLPDSGTASASVISAQVLDGAGQPVPNPVSGNSGADNVQFEIVGDGNGAQLSASSASGSATGTTVNAHTINGIATASFLPGSVQGPVQIKATSDRADNNVTNGITDPVAATTTVVVSDGKLFSIVITSPTTNAIQVNPVSSNVTTTDGNITIPTNPDGSYSLTISAMATDRQGNPVVPGTPIEFGVVDAPMSGFPDQGAGGFLIGGNDGNPSEGNIQFTAPTGHFRSAGPGDTLLVFGKFVEGNRDLESARQIQTIFNDTSLNVTYRFNPNDDSGTTVNSGAVLPYVIGHAEEGNIGATGTTDEHGLARTTLNYPVSRIGKGALIWARGAGAPVNGTPRLVTDISGGGFPGVAPGQLVVSQTPLPGNASISVTVCLYDALGAPIQGSGIGFGFTNLGLGTGSIDGTPTAGTFANPTNVDGCTTGDFETSGLAASGSSGTSTSSVTFTAGPSVPALNVPITVSGNLVLQASPSSLGGTGGAVTLLLTDASGNPVPNAQLSAVCTAGAGAGIMPATDANGRATTTITANLNSYGEAKTATCTFSTALQGGPTAVVNLQGTDLCTVDPTNSQCDGGTTPTNDLLTVVIVRGPEPPAATTVAVNSTPAGITCNLTANAANTLCSASFADGATVLLNATATPAAGRLYTWSGDCTGISGGSATVTLTAAATCTLTVH